MTSFDDVDPDVEAELASAFTEHENDDDHGDDERDVSRTKVREPRRRLPRPDLIGWAKRSRSSSAKTPNKPSTAKTSTAKTSTAKTSGPAKKSVGGKTRFVISDDAPRAERGTQAAPIGRSRFRERRIAVRRAAGRMIEI